MEKLSHSRQPTSLPKKTYNVANGGALKSMYDDVFAAPPRFVAPTMTTLSPRVEDYKEIFGSYHAPRATSIPVLDLPVVDDDRELVFDVRSSGFDYGEVFGGFDGSDFAVSFEELMMMDQSNGCDDGSSDEAWTPEAEYLSEESDHSAKNEGSSNGDSSDSIHGGTEFNISYHQVGSKGIEHMENGITHVTRPPSVPEYAFMFDRSASSLRQTDTVYTANGEGRRELRKTLSQPVNGGVSGPYYENEVPPYKGYARNSSLPSDRFFTVSNVSLQTQPSDLPPPSRLPPASLDARKGGRVKPTPDYTWFASEGNAGNGSTTYFDIEGEVSPSAQASTAAIIEAMERAQEKLRSAKESMARKKEGSRSHIRSGAQRTVDKEGIDTDFYVIEESKKLTSENLVNTGTLEGKRQQAARKNLKDEKHGRESVSSQGSDKVDEAAEWKEATHFFELVNTNKARKPLNQTSNDNILVQNMNNTLEHMNTAQEFEKKLLAPQGPSFLTGSEKKYSPDQKLTGADRRQTRIDDLRKDENKMEGHFENSQFEAKKKKHDKKKTDEKEDQKTTKDQSKHSSQIEDSTQVYRGFLNVDQEEVENGRRSDIEINLAKEERTDEVAEMEEIEKNMRHACEGGQNQKKLKGTRNLEETGRAMEALGEGKNDAWTHRETDNWEENEKKLGKTYEKTDERNRQHELSEENGKRQLDVCEREDKQKRLNEALKKEKNGRMQIKINESRAKEISVSKTFEKEFEAGNNESLSREETENGLKDAQEHDEKGKSTQAVQEEEEMEMGLERVQEVDELDGTMQEARKLDETQNMMLFSDTVEIIEPSESSEDYIVLNKEFGMAQFSCKDEGSNAKKDGTKESAQETEKLPNKFQDGKKEATVQYGSKTEATVQSSDVLLNGKTEVSSIASGCKSENHNNELPCTEESVKKADVAGNGIEERLGEKINTRSSTNACDDRKNISQSHVYLNGDTVSSKVVKDSPEIGSRTEVSQAAKVKGNTQQTYHHINEGQIDERKLKSLDKTMEEKEAERVRREKELERLRKMEEEMEREREREKDRMAVDTSVLEARDKAFSEARERADRAAVERAMAEARERLEKACAEARGRAAADKAYDARMKTERSAAEKAAAEARERAFEKVMAERAAFESRNRFERSVSDKFYPSSRNGSTRATDLRDHSPGSFNGSRYQYATHYNGTEGESAERCRARLERHRRTDERGAKALAEKNKRDLLAQREQAERNRLAETLDAEVKRWSNGKEGNLRALLSTLQYILGPNSGWQPIPLTEVITSAAVKKAYRKAMLCVHPDKLQQRGASIQQKYICEKVFDLLKEAWNKFNSEER